MNVHCTCFIQLLNFLDDALALNDACFLLRTLFEKDIYSSLQFLLRVDRKSFLGYSAVLSIIKYYKYISEHSFVIML